MLVLHQRLVGAVDLDQRGHQLHVQPVVEVVHVQRRAADVDDLLVVLLLLEKVDVGVDGHHVFIVQRGAPRQRPLVLLAVLQKIAHIQADEPRIQRLFRLGVVLLLRQLVENLLDFEDVHRHARPRLPVVRAAVGHDAPAQTRRNLVQQRAQAADQRLQGVLRVGALVLGPERGQQAVVGRGLALMQNQILHQRDALAGLVDQIVRLLLVDIDGEVIHHLDAYLIVHVFCPQFVKILSDRQNLRVRRFSACNSSSPRPPRFNFSHFAPAAAHRAPRTPG